MSRGIDYSKWDHLECDDSEEEEKTETHHRQSQPPPTHTTKVLRVHPDNVRMAWDENFTVPSTTANTAGRSMNSSITSQDVGDRNSTTQQPIIVNNNNNNNKSSRGIDYSKWDNMECDSDSEEEEAGVHHQSTPQVTKLDHPSQVTWKSDGSMTVSPMTTMVSGSGDHAQNKRTPANNNNKNSTANKPSTQEVSPTLTMMSSTSTASTGCSLFGTTKKKKNTIPLEEQEMEWSHEGGIVTLPDSIINVPNIMNGNIKVLYWSQDRTNVTIRWRVPPISVLTTTVAAAAAAASAIPTTPNRKLSFHVKLVNGVPYRERYRASIAHIHDHVDNNPMIRPTLIVSYGGPVHPLLLWQAEMPYPVNYDEDEDDDDDDDEDNDANDKQNDYVDWSLEHYNDDDENVNGDKTKEEESGARSYLRVTWNKAVPMEGMTMWWKRPFLCIPELDEVPGKSYALSSVSFHETWTQAHEQFKAKLRREKKESRRQKR